ncbi:small S protein [Colletotrichum tofieldiae]|nr:small S protein [Colletotrichum tofieldiae]GKT78401.1 small S protein [Colletotrichum tofieldiae]GKT85763.1 small S protein [Colletotrichum tofieldiae]
MAESLAALGVAANIVQFLELGLKATISIVETSRSINDDGWTSRNVDLDIMAKDLRLHCDRLQEDADIKLDASMKRLLQRCIDTADELSSELRGLAGDDAKRHQK